MLFVRCTIRAYLYWQRNGTINSEKRLCACAALPYCFASVPHICVCRYPWHQSLHELLSFNAAHSLPVPTNWAALLTCLRSSEDCVNIAFVRSVQSQNNKTTQNGRFPFHSQHRKKVEEKAETKRNEKKYTESQLLNNRVDFTNFIEFRSIPDFSDVCFFVCVCGLFRHIFHTNKHYHSLKSTQSVRYMCVLHLYKSIQDTQTHTHKHLCMSNVLIFI